MTHEDFDYMRNLIDTRQHAQKMRIGYGNRITAIEQGRDTASASTLESLKRWQERFQIMEDTANEEIKAYAQYLPIIDEMIKVKGVSFILAAKVACMINIQVPDTASALCRYAGFGVVKKTVEQENGNGEIVEVEIGVAERPVKGEKLHYNKRLKTTMHVVAGSFLKTNSPYRREYDEAKLYYQENRPDWTKGRIHMASIRKMVKLYLQHLWLTWRTMEGLPTNEPYPHAILGHQTPIKMPQEYGWEPLDKVVE